MSKDYELIEGYVDPDTGIKVEITREPAFKGTPIRYSEIRKVMDELWIMIYDSNHDFYKK